MKKNSEGEATLLPDDPIELEVKGEVVGCEKVYVRSEPKQGSAAICILDQGTIVTISDVNASPEFYKILGNGFEGFCMKQYIAIKAD